MTRTTDRPERSALLTESASRTARALVRWTAPELSAVARAVNDTLARTARRWGASDRVRQHVSALESEGGQSIHAEDADAALRLAAWTALGRYAHFSLAVDPVACLRDGLFGESPVSPGAQDGRRIADTLAADCWTEQVAALQALLDEAHADTPGAAAADLAKSWQRWSGAVMVQVPWFGTTWRVLLGAASVRALLHSVNLHRSATATLTRATPVSVLRALAKTSVCLQARLAPVDIDLGSLMSLRLGDVLRLGHAVDEPMRVVSSGAAIDSAPLCHGWLGRCDEHVALELARPHGGHSTTAST